MLSFGVDALCFYYLMCCHPCYRRGLVQWVAGWHFLAPLCFLPYGDAQTNLQTSTSPHQNWAPFRPKLCVT